MNKSLTSLALLFLVKFVLSYDEDLWAVVISSSHTYENYRHSVNSLLMYNILKKNIPDEHIILALSEYHACESRNYYPGKIYLSEENRILSECQKDIDIDFKEKDFHNFQLLDILRGRKMNQFSNYRQLNTNSNSRIIITVTSHGGEKFIKVRGKFVVLSTELHRTLNEMYVKKRFKEIVFVLDTCEGYSLYDDVDIPNIYFVASSLLNQKASSHSFDGNIMGPTTDRFHFLLYNELNGIYGRKEYDKKIDDLFTKIKEQKEFLTTDVAISNRINRTLHVSEFFGDPRIPPHKTETFSHITIDPNEFISNDPIPFNRYLVNDIKEVDKDVYALRTAEQTNFYLIFSTKSQVNRFSVFLIVLFCIATFGISIII